MDEHEDNISMEKLVSAEGVVMPLRPKSTTRNVLLSDEVNEIISHKPLWIIRNGITVIAGILVALLVLSWLVLYPDIVEAPLSVVAVNAPKKVMARAEGKIVSLVAVNGAAVREGDVLAYLESTAKHSEVLALQAWVKETEQLLNNGKLDVLASRTLPLLSSLGELQRSYYEFHDRYIRLQQTFAGGFYEQKQTVMQNDLRFMEEQLRVLANQRALAAQDYELQKTEYQTNLKLEQEKVIAPLELGREKSKLLAKANALRGIESQILNYQSGQQTKRREILELQREAGDYQQQFSSALFQFASEIDAWITRYIVIAPESGQVEYITTLQKNQFVNVNQELFYIAPANTGFYGEAIVSQVGMGKLRPGQEVIVELDSYPAQEYGFLHGSVENISPFPVRDNSFVVRVQLPQGMRTSYGKILPYKNNLQAKARIVTEDKRLLERMLHMLRQTFMR
jgi:HlyD family secretion protein